MNSTTQKRYIAEKTITQAGTYYDQTGRWTVRDTQPENPAIGEIFATGHERHMKRWARDLNAR